MKKVKKIIPRESDDFEVKLLVTFVLVAFILVALMPAINLFVLSPMIQYAEGAYFYIKPDQVVRLTHTGTGTTCPVITSPTSATSTVGNTIVYRADDQASSAGCFFNVNINEGNGLFPNEFFDSFTSQFGTLAYVIDLDDPDAVKTGTCGVIQPTLDFASLVQVDPRLNATAGYKSIRQNGLIIHADGGLIRCIDANAQRNEGELANFFQYRDRTNQTFNAYSIISGINTYSRQTGASNDIQLTLDDVFQYWIAPIPVNHTNNWWQMQEHPMYTGTYPTISTGKAEILDGKLSLSTGTANSERGQVAIFKQFNKNNFVTNLEGWDFSNNTFASFYDTVNVNPVGVFISNDGTRMFYTDTANSQLKQFTLTTPWVVSSAVFLQNSISGSPWNNDGDFQFSPDGTKLIKGANADDILRSYTVTPAWNLTGLTAGPTFATSSFDNFLRGIFIRNDGLRIYTVGNTGDEINEFKLTVPFDLSTASHNGVKSIGAQETDPYDVFFKPDGTSMYVIGRTGAQNPRITEYSLSPSWQVSTATFVRTDTLLSTNAGVINAWIREDGRKLFTTDTGNPSPDHIREYNIGDTGIHYPHIKVSGDFQSIGSSTNSQVHVEVRDGDFQAGDTQGINAKNAINIKTLGGHSFFERGEFMTYRDVQGTSIQYPEFPLRSLGSFDLSDLTVGTVDPFEISIIPNWSNSTNNVITIIVSVQDNSTSGRIKANITNIEIENNVNYNFTDIIDYRWWEPDCNSSMATGIEVRDGSSLTRAVEQNCGLDYSNGLIKIANVTLTGSFTDPPPAPNPPTAFTAVATAPDLIFLDWTHDLVNVTNYKIYRDSVLIATTYDPTITQFYDADQTNSTFATINSLQNANGLEPNTVYSYEICAVNGSTEETTCATDSETTPDDTNVWELKEHEGESDTTVDWTFSDAGSVFRIDSGVVANEGRIGGVVFKSFNKTEYAGSDIEWFYQPTATTGNHGSYFLICDGKYNRFNTTLFQNLIGPNSCSPKIYEKNSNADRISAPFFNERAIIDWNGTNSNSEFFTLILAQQDRSATVSHRLDITNVTITNNTSWNFGDVQSLNITLRTCDLNPSGTNSADNCDIGVVKFGATPHSELKITPSVHDWQYISSDFSEGGSWAMDRVFTNGTGVHLQTFDSTTNNEPDEKSLISFFKVFNATEINGENMTLTWRAPTGASGFENAMIIADGILDRWNYTQFSDTTGNSLRQPPTLSTLSLVPIQPPFALRTDTFLINTTSATSPEVTALLYIWDNSATGIGDFEIQSIQVGGSQYFFNGSSQSIEVPNERVFGDRGLITPSSVLILAPPDAPSSVNATADLDTVKIEWTPVTATPSVDTYWIQRSLLNPFDEQQLTFVQFFSISAQDTDPYGIFLKPDGTKLFLLGNSGKDVNEYTLSTPYDISTMSFVTTKSVVSQDSNPRDIHFKPDGTKMFMSGTSTDTVYQYTLSTPWDITTASVSGSFSIVGTVGSSHTGFYFKPDGTKMYHDSGGTSVYEFTLSTPWDITTSSLANTFSLSPKGLTDLFISDDGLRMVTVDPTHIARYDLNTAWDVSSASFTSETLVSAQDTFHRSIFVDPTGTKFYTSGNTNDRIYQYTTADPFEVIGNVSYLDPQIFNDTTQQRGTYYIYDVFGENTEGNGTSTSSNLVLTNDVPAQVQNLDAQPAVGPKFNIQWDALPFNSGEGNPSTGLNLTKYQIWRNNVTTGGGFFLLAENLASSPPLNYYNDTNIIIGNQYQYQVSGCNDVDCGTNSTSFLASFPSVPQPPQNVTAIAVNATVFVNWDDAVNATSYTIQRKNNTANEVTFTTIATGLTSSDYTDSGISKNHDFTYQVYSINIAGNATEGVPAGQPDTEDLVAYYQFNADDLVTSPTNGGLKKSIQNLGILGTRQDAGWQCTLGGSCTGNIEPTLTTGLIGQAGLQNASGVQGTLIALGNSTTANDFRYLISNALSNKTTLNFWVQDPSGGALTGTDIVTPIFGNEKFDDFMIRTSSGSSALRMSIEQLADADPYRVFTVTGPSIPSNTNWHMITLRQDKTNATSAISICVNVSTCFSMPPVSGFNSYVAPTSALDGSIAKGPLTIGKDGCGGGSCKGRNFNVDEVAMWSNSVLSTSELNYLYNSGLGVEMVVAGAGSVSNIVTTNDVPTKPLNLNGAMAVEKVSLTWNAPADIGTGNPSTGVSIINYQIERKQGVNPFAFLANTPNSTSAYLDASVISGANYTYKVRGLNQVGYSPFSDTFSIIATPLLPPNAPTSLIATAVSSSQINLSWTAPAGGDPPTGYMIQRKHVGFTGFVTIVPNTGTTSTTYSNTGLVAGGTYEYRVAGVNGAGTGAFSNIASATTFSIPTAPQNLVVSNVDNTKLNLSWSAPSFVGSGIINYAIERESPIGGGFSFLTNTTLLTFQDTGLTQNTFYNYRVRALNDVGYSPYSNQDNKQTYGVPDPPTNLQYTTNGVSQITLTWDAPVYTGGVPITGYTIDQAQNVGGTFVTVTPNHPATPTTKLYNGLLQQTFYIYKIATKNSFGTSIYTLNLTATTFAGPAQPENLFGVFDPVFPYNVDLTWSNPLTTPNNDVDTYTIQRLASDSVTWVTIAVQGNTTSYSDFSPLNQVVNSYRVRASDNSIQGAFTPSQPVNTVLLPQIGNITITNSSVAGNVLKIDFQGTIDECFPTCELFKVGITQNATFQEDINQIVATPRATTQSWSTYYTINEPVGTVVLIDTEPTFRNAGGTNSTTVGTVVATVLFDPNKNLYFQHQRNATYTGIDVVFIRQPHPWDLNCELTEGLFAPVSTFNISNVGSWTTTFGPVKSFNNAYVTCYDPLDNNKQIVSFTSFGLTNGTTAVLAFTNNLGDFLGVPVPFIFILFLTAIWTGRSASTGIIFLAVAIGAMGVLGYFPNPDTGDPLITAGFWSMIVLLTALGVFVGKRFF